MIEALCICNHNKSHIGGLRTFQDEVPETIPCFCDVDCSGAMRTWYKGQEVFWNDIPGLLPVDGSRLCQIQDIKLTTISDPLSWWDDKLPERVPGAPGTVRLRAVTLVLETLSGHIHVTHMIWPW